MARPFACASAAFLLSLALAGGEGHATPRSVRLDYVASADCPGAAEFKAGVTDRLGYDPFLEGATEHVLVHIDRRGAFLDGKIEWRDLTGKWTGEQAFPGVSSECSRLARTMGFALALQIQLLAKAASPPAPPQPLVQDAPAPTPEVVNPPAVPEAPVVVPLAKPPEAPAPPVPGPWAAQRTVFALGVGPSIGLGMSSSPVWLGRVFGLVAWRRFSLELAALGGLPTVSRRLDGAGFSQQHLLGSAAGCGGGSRWSACVVANGGVVRLAGEDIDLPKTDTAPVFAVGARLGLRQDLGQRVFVSARAEGFFNVVRLSGTLDKVAVWTAPRAMANLGVDLGVYFP